MSPIRRTLWGIALSLVALTLIANALVSMHNTQRLARGTSESAVSREAISAIDALLTTVVDAETGQRGYLLTERPTYLRPYHDAVRAANERLQQLRELFAANPRQQERLGNLQPLIERKFDELRRTVDLQDAGHHDEAMHEVATDEGMQLMADIRARIDELRSAELQLQRERDVAAQRIYVTGQTGRIVGAVIGLLLIALVFALLMRDLAARQRGAHELFLQREWLHATLHSIGDAVIVCDPHGRVQLLNPIAEQLTGWSDADARGRELREVFDIINETTREPAQDPVQRALDEGHTVGLANHTVLRSRDGREYVIEDSAAPARDARGNVQGAVMVFHDATERRRAEIALSMASQEIARRASEALVNERTLNTILENAPIGICMTGPAPDYPIVVISRLMQEWIGAAQGMPALSAYRKLLPDGREPPPDLIPLNRVMQHGQYVRDEPWLIERKGGPPLTVIVNVAPVRDEEGTIVGAVHSWVDLTERQHLDHELRVSQSRLRVLVEANVIGLILSFDGNGNVIQANKAFLDMLGFDANDVAAGRLNLAVQTPPESLQADREAFDELADLGFCTPYEKEFFSKGSERRIAVVVGYAKVAEADNEYVGFALDISARKDLERKLRDRTEELLGADKRKDEFLAMLAHELRNPLAPLRNVVHLLDTPRATEASFVANLLPMMRRQIDHLVRLVDDLLDAARISQGKITIERKIVEIRPSVRAAIESLEPLIKARGHRLELDLERAPLYVLGDATRLTQMFSNILHNAAKYTPNGGVIRLSLAREGGEAVVRVRDNGQGISPTLLPRIFETFIQDDQSLARSAGGLGVGLALVRRLTELHGGSVSATSAGPGQGSEFELRLPLADAASSASAESPPRAALQDAAHGAKQRVLVVDDNADLAASMATLLELWGHEVRVLHDGRDALDAARAFHPDAVLLDIGLPGIDGFEIARAIRAAPDLRNLRLIAITGYGQSHDRARAIEVGFDAHLIKPVQPEVLANLLGDNSTPAPA
jgi:PAS domain S-box-containing protein